MSAGTFYNLFGKAPSLLQGAEKLKADKEIIDGHKNKMMKIEGGKAEVLVEDDFAIMASDDSTAVAVCDGSVILAGKTHISAPPSQIRVNGFWVFNEELLTTIPSTLFNPVQTLIYKAPPYADKAKRFVKLMEKFKVSFGI